MRIVALGDSLTAGLQTTLGGAYSFQSNPYTRYLRNMAQDHLNNLKSDIEVEIINAGVCGELTSDMLKRFGRDVVEKQPSYVIIVGGTNDIGWGLDPNDIFVNLRMMYDMAESSGVKNVACTIPSILGFDGLIPPRLELNSRIRMEAERRGMGFVDLFEATSDPETKRLLRRYSGDGLHLNTEGYRRMGEVIFSEWLKGVLDQYTKHEVDHARAVE